MKRLTKELLEKAAEFYNKEHSMKQTAEMLYSQYGVKRHFEVLRRNFIKAGIPRRSNKEVARLFVVKKLPEETIKDLINKYSNHNHSVRKLSRDLKLTRKIVKRALINFGVKFRDNNTANVLVHQKYAKHPFDGDEKEKAYMIGLVKGDLTPIQKSSNILRLSVASTHKNFLEFLKDYFAKYGPSHIYPTKNNVGYQWNMSIDLDVNSFSFLIKSKTDNNITFDDNSFYYFLAGLIDSDGAVYTRKSHKYAQYIIRIFGEDKELLEKIKNRFKIMGHNPSFYINSKKGDFRYYHNKRMNYNKDYYILELSRKKEVFNMLNKLPLRHPEKIARKEIMLKFIKNGVISHSQTEEMMQLRNKIDNEVKKYSQEAEYIYKNKI
jgi:hypothetical protein